MVVIVYCDAFGGMYGVYQWRYQEYAVADCGTCIRNEFKHLLHPNAVLPVRINKQTVSSSIVTTVLIFFAFYLVLILIGWTVLLFLGVGFTESVSTVISSIGNVGPGLGTCGPAFSWNSLPDPAKWILSFLMLVGRLELFSVLLLFYPGFWKNR